MCAGVVAVDRRDDEGRLLRDGICSAFVDVRGVVDCLRALGLSRVF